MRNLEFLVPWANVSQESEKQDSSLCGGVLPSFLDCSWRYKTMTKIQATTVGGVKGGTSYACVDRPIAPRFAVVDPSDGPKEVSVTGSLDSLVTAVGDAELLRGLLSQMVGLGAKNGRVDADTANFVIGFVDGMAPRDPAEALLCTQMAAVHQAMMAMARRLAQAGTSPKHDTAERALNKLARTFAAQMETLKRYRSNGQQVVRVERVTVESGGQAIVGAISHGGRGSDEY